MLSLPKVKWKWFTFLVLLVGSTNLLIYRLDFMQPLPKEVALGSLFDFIITIPLLTYFFIFRKRISLKYLLLVVIAGYGVASFIIPSDYLTTFSYIKYIIFGSEGILILLELYIVFKLATKLPSIIKSYRMQKTGIQTFHYKLEQALQNHLKSSRLLDVISSEISIFYYSIFSWKKKNNHLNQVVGQYTFHKKTAVIAFYVMIIHALVLESIGFHYLLHSWNEIFAFVILGLNIYSLFFLLAEIQAIRLCPLTITNEHLHIQVGIMKQLTIPLEEIKSIQYYQGPEKLNKEEMKIVFDAVHADFTREKPTFEIEFHKALEMKFMYGIKRKVTKVHLSPDEPDRFLKDLSLKIN